ncbi:uncharacterized protein BDZ83DRAFT_122670 [Colletotrichum acutatum]|uniref:Uncharacterized protein n=1 Tax=Glomerella acutata TaxID=27357 RepID=A0AAD8XBY4_GLOAC|nr:uncharacterized protein BDZ83DRAFT_122670 [Colletotrichum acutatum]KAK1710913.1 hypothetical protein BDZ83DRAFT_122670 [Colletotrichum acutatum]
MDSLFRYFAFRHDNNWLTKDLLKETKSFLFYSAPSAVFGSGGLPSSSGKKCLLGSTTGEGAHFRTHSSEFAKWLLKKGLMEVGRKRGLMTMLFFYSRSLFLCLHSPLLYPRDTLLPKGFLGIQRSNSPTYHTDPPGFDSALSHNKELQRNPNTKILNQSSTYSFLLFLPSLFCYVSFMIVHARKPFFEMSSASPLPSFLLLVVFSISTLLPRPPLRYQKMMASWLMFFSSFFCYQGSRVCGGLKWNV